MYFPVWPKASSLTTKKARHIGLCKYLNGAPGRIRTCDLQIRSLLLYPAELRAHFMAEREGFEPSRQLLAVYSLSRRAPSAISAISPHKNLNFKFCFLVSFFITLAVSRHESCRLKLLHFTGYNETIFLMAEEVGFEPTEPVKVQRFSRPPPSTARTPLHIEVASAMQRKV